MIVFPACFEPADLGMSVAHLILLEPLDEQQGGSLDNQHFAAQAHCQEVLAAEVAMAPWHLSYACRFTLTRHLLTYALEAGFVNA